MNAATLINQTSGKVEYYTPSAIIEAARRTMGAIDLDPASCAKANEVVKAADFISETEGGLNFAWTHNGNPARVWLNHPFGRKTNSLWINYLLKEWNYGNILEACCITFACTSEAWFRPLMEFPQCFLSPRTNYYGPGGKMVRGVTKGSVVTYLGPDVGNFVHEFRALGVVKGKL